MTSGARESSAAVVPATPVAAARAPSRPLDRVGRGLADWLPAVPLLTLALLFLLLPTAQLVARSFGSESGTWTLEYWRETLNSRGGRQAIRTSLELGVICATLSLLIGGPLAWLVSRLPLFRRSVWLSVLNVAANFGGIGLAFGYLAALGTYGMVTLALQDSGLPFDPPEIGSITSLVIAYEYSNIPLFVLLTLPAMSILRQDWMEAAETSAATRWQFWRYIGLPILSPFLIAGWLLIFTWSIGIYGLAYAMGAGASTIGRLRLITLQIGLTLNTGAGSEERAIVLAVILLLFASVSLVAYRIVIRWALRWFS